MTQPLLHNWRARLAHIILGLAGMLTGAFVGYTYTHGGAQLLPFLAGLVLLNIAVAVPLQIMLHRAEERRARRKHKPMPHQPWHAGWKPALASFSAGLVVGAGVFIAQDARTTGAT